MRKNIICAIILIIASGCAKQSESTSTNGTEENKVVWVAYGYHSEAKDETIITAFNELYPDVEVEYRDLSSDDYLVHLDTMVAANERVDMALAMSFDEYAQRAINGMFLPIEKYIIEDGFDIIDGFGPGINASYIDGNLYGLPYTKGGFYLFYNRQMFDQADESYPTPLWSWEEFEAAADRLNRFFADDAYGAAVHLGWDQVEMLPAFADGWTMFKGDNRSINFNDERIGNTLAMWERMQNISRSIPQRASLKATKMNPRMPFAQGKAAMLLSNWWSLTWLKNYRFTAESSEAPDFPIGIVNPPRADSNKPENLNSSDLDYYFTAPRTAKNPRYGILLARFMITDMWPKFGVLSSYRHADVDIFKQTFNRYTDEEGNVLNADFSDEQIKTIMGGDTIPFSVYFDYNPNPYPEGKGILSEIYNQERDLYFTGEQDLQTTLDKVNKRTYQELEDLN